MTGRVKCSLLDAAYLGTSGQCTRGRMASDKSVHLPLFCLYTLSRLQYCIKTGRLEYGYQSYR